MINPYELIQTQLNSIEEKINLITAASQSPIPPKEIIDRKELCKRLAITEPTVIRWEKRGKIPVLHIGNSVRYNWPTVIDALENKRRG